MCVDVHVLGSRTGGRETFHPRGNTIISQYFLKPTLLLADQVHLHHESVGLVAEPQEAHARAPPSCVMPPALRPSTLPRAGHVSHSIGDEIPAKRTGHLSPSTADEPPAKRLHLPPFHPSPRPTRTRRASTDAPSTPRRAPPSIASTVLRREPTPPITSCSEVPGMTWQDPSPLICQVSLYFFAL